MWAVLATGPSMSQQVADSVKGHCNVVAVSDSYRLAPWADMLVSSDAAWWRHHNPEFQGRKYSLGTYSGVEKVHGLPPGTNSGLFGLMMAVREGADRVILLGVDLHGTHFFGPHVTLRNSSQSRIENFKQQFAKYQPKGVEIINCSPGSHLNCYPKAKLCDVLAACHA